MDDRAGVKVIEAYVPLANMFGYVGDLRSLSQGRAQFSMVFEKYQAAPESIAKEVSQKRSANKTSDDED
jgi:elongation factor G